MKKTAFFTLAAILALATGSWVFLRNGEATPVKTILAAKGEITATLSATGKVVSRQSARVSAAVAGRVQAVDVQAGDRVATGAVLAMLDDREIGERVKGAQAALREADEKVRRLKRDCRSLAAVYAAGGTSRQSVADAKSSLEIAQAALNRASAELNESKVTRDKLEVTAPFAGIVTRKEINPGEWVAPGKALFTLADESSRQIEVMVDESDAGLVKVGQAVAMTSDAFPGLKWLERVTEVDPAVHKEEGANSIRVRVTCGARAPNLKLGQQVDAKIRTAHRVDIVKLPFECLTGTAGQTSVAMIRDGRAHFVPVVTGIEDDTSVEIGKGVPAGEAVIVPQGKPLKEGQRVKVAGQEPSRQ
jgi:membrane fusion protein, multidrug efflux system